MPTPSPPATAGDRPPPEAMRRAEPVALVLATAQTMEAMLTMATGLVTAGRRVDLAGLEKEAARLVAAASICPAEAAAELRLALMALRARLDLLGVALRRD